MDESKILSNEEMNVISQAASEPNSKALNDVLASFSNIANQSSYTINYFTNQLTRECERIFSAFLKKQVSITQNAISEISLGEMLNSTTAKRVYSIYLIQPYHCHGIFAIDLPLLHHVITLLYGGQIDPAEATFEDPGETGLLVSDKLCQLNLEGLINAFKEFGKLDCKIVKSTAVGNFSPYISLDENFFVIDYVFKLEELQTHFQFYINRNVLNEMLPGKLLEDTTSEKSSWMQSMHEQITGSYVTASVQLDTINLHLKDILELKEGDVIPINDPTQTYICLNNVRLFKAQTGQANGKRVIKIIGQV